MVLTLLNNLSPQVFFREMPQNMYIKFDPMQLPMVLLSPERWIISGMGMTSYKENLNQPWSEAF